MNKNRISHSTFVSSGLALAAALVVLFTSAAFASSPQGTFEKTLTVNGPVDLEVFTHSGDVTVRAGASGSVSIRGKIFVSERWFGGSRDTDVHAIEQNPPIKQSGNSIHIDYVDYHNISIDYEITVPADTTVRSHTGSGDQTIDGTKGNADIQTGSGNIVAHGVHGGFRGETGSGDITAEGTQTSDWDIHTGSGTVRVRLPGNAAFDADISTSSGTVDVNAPVEMTVQGRVQDMHKSIHGKVRGGGPVLRVRTGSGDIHIE